MNIGPTGGGGSAHLPQQAKPLAASTPAAADKPEKAEASTAKAVDASSEVKPVSSAGTAGSIINTSA